MVRAVASRVVPRARISKAIAKEKKAEAAARLVLAKHADVPESVNSIPTHSAATVDELAEAGAVIRPMGCSRRVYLLDPHLSANELEGLAYRIRALAKNESINSVLIATNDRDDAAHNCIPNYSSEELEPNYDDLGVDFDPVPGSTWHVSGGYNPLDLAFDKDGNRVSQDNLAHMMDSVRKLGLATKGEDGVTKVPVITMPHGAISDAGYALCLGSYVLATPQTCFRILNPSRGLGLDPVGFSYLLPRLGWEFKQRSSKYKGCGMLLALAGFEAKPYDMVETGLATHTVSSAGALSLLEYGLAMIPPYEQQNLVKKWKRYYGQRPVDDANAKMRNVAVANVVDQFCNYAADKSNSLPVEYWRGVSVEDPAFDVDIAPWEAAFFTSDLVDIAATFDEFFKEATLEGLVERFREVASRHTEDPEEQEGIDVAKQFVENVERQSPLALRVVHKLLALGIGNRETLENCMERERNSQVKLLQGEDFYNWAQHVSRHGGDESKAPPFTGWKHKNVASVTADEVDEILSGIN